MKLRLFVLLISLLAIQPGRAVEPSAAPPSTAAPYQDTETPADRAARMAWWRDARFGLFIHYGPVSLTGRELSWSRANSNPRCPNHGPTPVAVYDNLHKQFDPEKFNAAAWADIAKEAGMKYVVLTVKHCDGFLLWDSKVDGYNIAATPFKRDMAAELAKAVRADGLRMGWYFSPMDWRDPDFRTARNPAFVQRMQAELRELLTNYGKIDLLWFDTDGYSNDYDVADTYRLIKSLQPAMLVDNRLDMGTRASYKKQAIIPPADYYTPEQRIGSYDGQRPWETCETLGKQWSWKPKDHIKSVSKIIADLADCAGGDGNLLLDVGPMPDGEIEPRQVDVLKGVGLFLKKNGESIYGTRGGPYKPAAYGASTRKGNQVYIHVLKWPQGPVTLPPLPARVVSAKILGGENVQVQQTDQGLQFSVPPQTRDPSDTVVVLTLDKPAQPIPAITVP